MFQKRQKAQRSLLLHSFQLVTAQISLIVKDVADGGSGDAEIEQTLAAVTEHAVDQRFRRILDLVQHLVESFSQ